MSGNFDWQTEEDDRRAQTNWDEPVEAQRSPPTRRPLPWRLIAVVAVLVAAVGGIVWWRIDRQIEDTLHAFRTDVIASHNLIQRAAADGDQEIFRSALSGRLPSWTAAELDVFEAGMFTDRASFGLTPVEGSLPLILDPPDEEAAAGESAAEIVFSPDLNEAIVTVNQPFVRQSTDETVVLQQTAIFRRGDSRWLLAPPLEEFWGDWITTEGDYLSLIYPARDADVAERLAGELDAEISRLCETLEDIRCSADLHLTARLATDPAALAAVATPLGALIRARQDEDILELPAPTLVGLPAATNEDTAEAGYAALRDGYARHLLAAVVAQAVNWNCCEQSILFDILLEYQLGELGFLDWSVDEADYRQVMESRLRLSDLNYALMNRLDPAEASATQLQEARTAVDFLANGVPGLSAAGLQRAMGSSRNINRFLNNALAAAERETGTTLPNNLDLALWIYAFQVGSTPPEPVEMPADEDLYLTCTATDGNQSTDTSTLLRYAADAERWAEMYSLSGFIWLSALPDPTTLLMQEFSMGSEAWQTNVWRADGRTTVYEAEANRFALSLGETDPQGRRMVTYSFDPEYDAVRAFVIDLADCDGDCATADVIGLPFWSPDGQWAVYMDNPDGFPQATFVAANERYVMLEADVPFGDRPLFLGPGDAEPGNPDLAELGEGYSPFWLDERTFGYIRRLPRTGRPSRGDEEIVLATIDAPAGETLITAADLYQSLPDTLPTGRLSLAYVATHPGQPEKLFIVALDDLEQRVYVIIYDLATRLPETRLELGAEINHSLGFSPDGRYLVLTGYGRRSAAPGDMSGQLLLHDVAENRTYPFMTLLPFFLPSVVYDWSDDGRLLAMAFEDNLIGIIAPDERSVELLSHGYGNCTSVAWLME